MKLGLLAALMAATLAMAQAPATKPAAPAKPAKPAAAAPAPAKPAAATGFLGNKDSKIFHKADCKLAAKMKDANKVTFAAAADATKEGYKPCKVCKPLG